MSDQELIKKYVPEQLQDQALKKLANNYPVQYIIGNVDFYNCFIKVNENVLIPRFETEYLVEKTLKYIGKFNFVNPQILEIGTGSGCISIALKKNLNCEITALDISKDALTVALENAHLNQVEINFLEQDIHNFKNETKYDVIISNPPYVPFNSVVSENIKYEPQNAIHAKEHGIYFYKIILEKIKNNLKNNYLIAFEIGDNEGEEITKIVSKYLPDAFVLIEKDYNNYERYLFITNNNKIFNSVDN